MNPPPDDLLFLLKSRGPQLTADIARHLGISRQAVMKKLDTTRAAGLAEPSLEHRGVGRPRHSWSLTAKGHLRFPDTHAQMTVELIDAVREEFGAKGLDRLVARREGAVAEGYRRALRGADTLKDRVARLAELRTAEGYMADWQALEGGGYLLLENHCPICAAAEACQGFCRSELMLFRALLAPARVERTEHILAGARRCAYRVEPDLG